MPANLSRLIRLTPSARSDRDLLRAHLDGTDPTAFDELVHRHAGLAKRAAAEVCPSAAEDAAQTALALLARNAAAVASRESAAGWVFQTARRLALKARTAAARRSAREAQASPPQSPSDPLDTLTLREVRAAVAEELARLPDELRLPLVLCYWDGSTRPEAAARLGCSLSTLMRRLDAGRDRLAGRLARRGFAGSAVLAALTLVQAGADAAIPVARSAVAGFAPWKMLSVIVVAASVVAAGIGIGVSAPVSADPPAQPAQPATPPIEIAQPRPAVDRYGDPLPEGAITRFGTVRFRHGEPLESIAYSPDGKMIASGGYGRLMLWEAQTGKPLLPVAGKDHGSPNPGISQHGHISGLAFTPNSKRLVSVGSQAYRPAPGEVVFWDVAAGRLEADPGVLLEARDGASMQAVAVSPDGKIAVVATFSGTLKIVDLQTQTIHRTVKIDGVAGLSIAPDGKTLAVATSKGIVLLDLASGKEVKRLEPGLARQVVFAPDGKSIWVGCDGGDSWKKDNRPGTISRWDFKTGTALETFKTVPGRLLSLAISPDGKTLASGGHRGGPFLWDAVTGRAVDLAPPGPRFRPSIPGLVFAPDGKILAVADSNGQVRIWDVANRQELHRRDEHVGGVLNVALSPDGKSAATAGGDGTVRIWDMATGRAIKSWTADDYRSVISVTYSPDGHSMLTSGSDGTVRLWDVASGQEIRRFRNIDRGYSRAALSPDGKLVAASGKDGVSIILYETATGQQVRELTGHVSLVMSLAFSLDGKRLVSTADMHYDGKEFDDRSVRVWDVATGRQLQKFDAGRPQSVAISPYGRVVAAYGIDSEPERAGYLRFWDTATGKEIFDRRVRRGNKDLWAIAFSADGRYLATSYDNDIQLVEVASGQLVQSFESGAATVYGLTFTPDGRGLVSAHDDGTALVWDLIPRSLTAANAVKRWDELASDDAAVAHRAVWALASDPAAAVAMLGEKLKPIPKPVKARATTAIIAELDHPNFQTRDAARRELIGRVEVDSDLLSAALAKATSAEVRKQLSDVLQSHPGPWPRFDAQDLRRIRAIGVLVAIGTPEARRVLKALADGDPYAFLTRTAQAASRRLGE
jgi:RNA polymerase sigma factor (sigma-70 family)